MRSRLPPLLVACLLPAARSQDSRPLPTPATVAERSGFTETSRHDDVLAFLEALRGLPLASRMRVETLGTSGEGKPIPLVIVSDPPLADAAAVRRSGKLRMLVNANIHAGEIEGKEAALILIRELVGGQHADLLEKSVLLFVPDLNPDGNDRIDKKNRVSQNGPDGGVGRRENAKGLDLNRDFVKLETPEVNSLLGAMVRYDPHVFMDLHTTNGSFHGYHLTWETSQCTNVDPVLAQFVSGTLLPGVRATMERNHGLRTYHYGNFGQENGGRIWSTFDHTPRYATNYFGLRNRIAILCEAYSYLSFPRRLAATKAFVLEVAGAAARDAGRIVSLCDAADRLLVEPKEPARFGSATVLADPVLDEILVGKVDRVELPGLGTRLSMSEEFERVKMPARLSFRSTQSVPLPHAWAILDASAEVRRVLAAHGVIAWDMPDEQRIEGEIFVPSEVRPARREYQGHRTVTLKGDLRAGTVPLPAGTLIVPAAQPLARLAAQLLEPSSEDSLATWNFFDSGTRVPEDRSNVDTARPPFQVVRLAEAPGSRPSPR